jgi:hypothetical protein
VYECERLNPADAPRHNSAHGEVDSMSTASPVTDEIYGEVYRSPPSVPRWLAHARSNGYASSHATIPGSWRRT